MKRVVAVVAITSGLVVGGATAAQAIGDNSTSAGGYWGCLGLDASDHAICVKNPLPERLPVPTTPTTPKV